MMYFALYVNNSFQLFCTLCHNTFHSCDCLHWRSLQREQQPFSLDTLMVNLCHVAQPSAHAS